MGSYVIIDLEMCKVPKKSRTKEYHWASETIQIGAVLLNEEYEITDKFEMYVKPEFGEISKFIEDLTGIKKSDVENALPMAEVLKKLVEWMPDDSELIDWSDSDERQIRYEITGKEIDFVGIDILLKPWLDCQKMFTKIMDSNRAYNLEEALNLSNIDYESRFHDGLVDASNTALLFKKMKTEKEFKFNEYYLNKDKEKETLTSSMGSMFAKAFAEFSDK